MEDNVRRLAAPVLLLIFLMILTAGCGGEHFNSPPPAPPSQGTVLASIAVTPGGPSIAPGTTQQFTATGTFSNGAVQVLTSAAIWASSDAAVADISNAAGSTGLATAAAAGQTTITATFNGVSGSTTITVSPVASLAVTPANPPSIAPGTAEQFIAAGTLADSTVQPLTTWATWASSDAAVVVVSDAPGSKGLAGATVPGPGGTAIATITATYTGVSGTATFKSSALVSSVVTPTTASIAKGTTQQFATMGTLFDATTQTLTTLATWSTSSAGVATISNASGSQGRATGVNVGAATITSLFTGITSSPAALVVTPAVLSSMTVTPANPSIALGNTRQFSAIGTFSDATTQNLTSSVTWTSSAATVAVISNATGSNGLASSVGVGSTTIRASSGSISASTTLTVQLLCLESITVAPAAATIFRNGTQQFTATGNFSDGTTPDLTASVVWNSSDEQIASISNTGLATANIINLGTTNITATLSGITSNIAVLNVSP